jgi:hypothetical protein
MAMQAKTVQISSSTGWDGDFTLICEQARADSLIWPGTKLYMADPWYDLADAIVAGL